MVAQYSIRFLPSDRQIIKVQTPWKSVPQVLRAIQRLPADISEARITKDVSIFYLDKEAVDLSYQLSLFTTVESFYSPVFQNEKRPDVPTVGVLSSDTHFLIYNRQGVSYTTMEVITEDRDGLLHDLIQLILAQPIRVDTLIVSTSVLLNGMVYAVFQLARDGVPLDVTDIVHINRSVHQAMGTYVHSEI